MLDKVKTQDPDDVELLALAGILHSFYSGFENIFKRIVKDIDGGFAKTESWHADLLEKMAVSTLLRSAVITESLKIRLQFFLSFRHAFRSMYSYNLNWPKMKGLIFDSQEILVLVEKELNDFMRNNAE